MLRLAAELGPCLRKVALGFIIAPLPESQHANAVVPVGRIWHVARYRITELFPSFAEAVEKVRKLLLLLRQANIVQAVEPPLKQPKVGINHRQVVGVGIEFEEIAQQKARPFMPEEPLQTVRMSPTDIQEERIRRRIALFFQCAHSLHEEGEDGMSSPIFPDPQQFGPHIEHFPKQGR